VGIFFLCALLNYKYSKAVYVGICADGVKTHFIVPGRIMIEFGWQNFRDYFVTKLYISGKLSEVYLLAVTCIKCFI